MAYPVDKVRFGTYILTYVEAPQEKVAKIANDAGAEVDRVIPSAEPGADDRYRRAHRPGHRVHIVDGRAPVRVVTAETVRTYAGCAVYRASDRAASYDRERKTVADATRVRDKNRIRPRSYVLRGQTGESAAVGRAGRSGHGNGKSDGRAVRGECACDWNIPEIDAVIIRIEAGAVYGDRCSYAARRYRKRADGESIDGNRWKRGRGHERCEGRGRATGGISYRNARLHVDTAALRYPLLSLEVNDCLPRRRTEIAGDHPVSGAGIILADKKILQSSNIGAARTVRKVARQACACGNTGLRNRAASYHRIRLRPRDISGENRGGYKH